MKNKLIPLITVILLITILITKSIYLLLGITILELILIFKSKEKIHIYIKNLNNFKIVFIILLLLYIILLRKVNLILGIYKFILIFALLIIYISNIVFMQMAKNIYFIMFFIKNTKKRYELSVSISLALLFIYKLLDNRELKLKNRISYSNYEVIKYKELLKLTYI